MLILPPQNIHLLPPTTLVGGTLSPTDKGANIAVLNGNLQANNAASAWQSVRSQNAVSSGVHQITIQILSLSSGYCSLGFMKSAASVNTYCGVDANGWAWNSYAGTPRKMYAGTQAAFGSPWVVGGYVKALLDFNQGTIAFYLMVSGKWVLQGGGPAFTGVSGSLYATLSLYGSCSLLASLSAY